MASAASRLGLGVARFGPFAGGPGMSTAEAFATLALAADAGIRLIDCPAGPDAAERTLGQVLPRKPCFEVTVHTARLAGGAGAILRRLRASLHRMGLDQVGAALAHPAALGGPEGQSLWNGLLWLKDQGVVGAVGIAACVCDDPVGLARRFRPDLMQLPLSLFDQRLLVSGVLDEVAGRGVNLHLRSILLPRPAAVGGAQIEVPPPLGPRASRLHRVLAQAGADPLQASLAFALTRPQASHVVVEVGSPAELRAVVKAASAPGLQIDWDALRPEAVCPTDPAFCRAA